jgi:tubulin--tyrosine ligase
MCKYINEHENDAWLVKPGENSNRGRGIKIFRTSEQIRDYIEEYQQKSVSNATTFIVQRYILDLMLYKKRKFDIRCYMLMTCFNGRIKGYWY